MRSIEGQRAAIERYAQTHSIDLVAHYVDDAISGTTRHRNSFQQMIADACCMPRPFDLVIVYDVSRFGRMDNDETGYYRHILRMHGVRVCYTTEGFVEASIDDLVRPVKQWHARQESKDLSRIVIRGHLSKFHSKGGGWWISGVSPFGYDRRYQDGQGQFLYVLRNMPDRTKQVHEAGNVLRVLLPNSAMFLGSVKGGSTRPVSWRRRRKRLARFVAADHPSQGFTKSPKNLLGTARPQVMMDGSELNVIRQRLAQEHFGLVEIGGILIKQLGECYIECNRLRPRKGSVRGSPLPGSFSTTSAQRSCLEASFVRCG